MALVTGKFIFYHIPRTGGCWFREMMTRMNIDWERVGFHHDYPSVHTDDFSEDGRVRVSITRNPFTWMVSIYRVLAQGSIKRSPVHPLMMFPGCRVNTFENFMDDYLNFCRGYVTRIYEAYHQGCRIIGKTEDLPGFLASISELTGAPIGKLIGAYNTMGEKMCKLYPVRWRMEWITEILSCEKDLFTRWGYQPPRIEGFEHQETHS